jgi:hypothetical protein
LAELLEVRLCTLLLSSTAFPKSLPKFQVELYTMFRGKESVPLYQVTSAQANVPSLGKAFLMLFPELSAGMTFIPNSLPLQDTNMPIPVTAPPGDSSLGGTKTDGVSDADASTVASDNVTVTSGRSWVSVVTSSAPSSAAHSGGRGTSKVADRAVRGGRGINPQPSKPGSSHLSLVQRVPTSPSLL